MFAASLHGPRCTHGPAAQSRGGTAGPGGFEQPVQELQTGPPVPVAGPGPAPARPAPQPDQRRLQHRSRRRPAAAAGVEPSCPEQLGLADYCVQRPQPPAWPRAHSIAGG